MKLLIHDSAKKIIWPQFRPSQNNIELNSIV